MGANSEKIHPIKIVPRLAAKSFSGSDTHAALYNLVSAPIQIPNPSHQRTYKTATAINGALFTNPTNHVRLAHSPVTTLHSGGVSAIPNSFGNDKFAPLEPVWSQPWMTAPREFITMVRYRRRGCRQRWVCSCSRARRSASVSEGMSLEDWARRAAVWKRGVSASRP